jgi:hypothetical protein
MANEITVRVYEEGNGTPLSTTTCDRGAVFTPSVGAGLAAGSHDIEVTCEDTTAGYAESAHVSAGTIVLAAGGVSDNFNRADGAIGSNWGSYLGGATVASNKAVGASESYMYWSGSGAPGNNQFVQGQLFHTTSAQPRLVARFAADDSCVACKAVDEGDESFTLVVEATLGGANALLGSYGPPSNTTWVKLSVVGLVVTLYTSTDGTAWTQRGQWTGSSANVPASGPPGFRVGAGVTGWVDNWAAGDAS